MRTALIWDSTGNCGENLPRLLQAVCAMTGGVLVLVIINGGNKVGLSCVGYKRKAAEACSSFGGFGAGVIPYTCFISGGGVGVNGCVDFVSHSFFITSADASYGGGGGLSELGGLHGGLVDLRIDPCGGQMDVLVTQRAEIRL